MPHQNLALPQHGNRAAWAYKGGGQSFDAGFKPRSDGTHARKTSSFTSDNIEAKLKGSASFFEKKEAKKLLLLGDLEALMPQPTVSKSFLLFFSKKKRCQSSSPRHQIPAP
jgi:hypothetical protein